MTSRIMLRYALALSVVASLASCGGGGGGGGPTPVPPVTVLCPNGSSQTAATADLANASCPLPLLVSITPADKATGVNLDTTAAFQVSVVTDSVLTVPSASEVSLKAGQNAVAGTIALVGTKGVSFTPS